MASYEATMLKLEKMAQANTATQMNWQEKMSKTSHQMEVADLKKAGLNPVLSSNQGANSYTTSVDSAVNGIASMASAREGANASRFAARQSAAATRAAAAAQLAAARESAAAARYAADQNLAAKKYEVDNKLPGNVVEAVAKVARNSGLENAVLGSSLIKGAIKGTGLLMNGQLNQMAKNLKYNANVGWPMLKADAKSLINKTISKLGLDQSSYYRNLVLKGIVLREPAAIRSLLFAINRNRKHSARSLR